ncbi:hypothetical protein GBA52_028249 [Prunus armeniaca]|nr:hypothetical protein GBA52_028249 [Prunus armeniaca]
MSHTIKSLISSYGANPTVYELDELLNGQAIERALVQHLQWKQFISLSMSTQRLHSLSSSVKDRRYVYLPNES